MSNGTLGIGEVIAALKAEFPDVSVSKIRFLESEGLIRPQRAASGYRRFTDDDIGRLRAILTMQRDMFLPLKVIRERLDAGFAAPEAALGSQPTAIPDQPRAPTEQPADDLTPPSPVRLTERDLADASGLEPSQVRALQEYGVICAHARNGESYFDEEDLTVGKIAREFLRFGIEPRHLKTLRRFAEQEVAMFQQLVTPAMRARRPDARQQAAETLGELARLARSLRLAYVRQSLRDALSER